MRKNSKLIRSMLFEKLKKTLLYAGCIANGFAFQASTTVCPERWFEKPCSESENRPTFAKGHPPKESLVHDVGGDESLFLKLDLSEKKYAFWERKVHALMVLLVSKGKLTVDELRRGIENLPPTTYGQWGYYEKWAASIATISIERGTFSTQQLDEALGPEPVQSPKLFEIGDRVRVLRESQQVRWRKPHLRTPGYVHGVEGTIERYCGSFKDPEFLAFRGLPQSQPLYRVRFSQKAIWAGYEGGSLNDTVDVEIYHPWLEKISQADPWQERSSRLADVAEQNVDVVLNHETDGHFHNQEGVHKHHYLVHEHIHEDRKAVELNDALNSSPESAGQRFAESLVQLVVDIGIISAAELTQAVEKVDNLGSKSEGPRLVARAWVDAHFRKRLIADANAAAAELGIVASNSTTFTKLTAVENTRNPPVHNVLVCTLCSCYPLSILGLSPPWYKSRNYRARLVKEPRKVLAEFGTFIDQETTVRVHDSTADLRYIVLPERPKETESWTEEQLQHLVTRDSMIGVRTVEVPSLTG